MKASRHQTRVGGEVDEGHAGDAGVGRHLTLADWQEACITSEETIECNDPSPCVVMIVAPLTVFSDRHSEK